MIYLVNQQCADIEMENVYAFSVVKDIENLLGTDMLISALDPDTAKFFSSELELSAALPEFDVDFFGDDALPDDIAITLADNLELGDTIIALERSPNKVGYGVYTYTQYE